LASSDAPWFFAEERWPTQRADQPLGPVEKMRMPGPDGLILDSDMEHEDGLVMRGCRGPDHRNGIPSISIVL
jgi:hypothetical protein